MIQELDTTGFDAAIKQESRPVLVDFWAPWCGPCRVQLPVLERLASNPENNYQVAKINVDDNQALAMRFQVSSIPTLIVFRDGQPVRRLVGLQSEESLRRALAETATATVA